MHSTTGTLQQRCLDSAALGNSDLLLRGSGRATKRLDLLDKLLALDNFAKDHVCAVEPGCLDGSNEELGAVGVLSGIGHRQEERLVMFPAKVLVLKLLPVNRFPACSIMASEIATLEHKLWDYSMKAGASIAEPILTGAKFTEVASGFGNDIVVELEYDTARRLAVDRDIEKAVRHDGCG